MGGEEIEMFIEIIPYERDKKSMIMYKFMRWFIRKHRKEIQNNTQEAIKQITLYGDIDWEKFKFRIEKEIKKSD